jgi:hypothetical protein
VAPKNSGMTEGSGGVRIPTAIYSDRRRAGTRGSLSSSDLATSDQVDKSCSDPRIPSPE